MFKIMVLLRRRHGLSREELVHHYENQHVPLTEKLIVDGKIPRAVEYRRNYFLFGDVTTTLTDREMNFDMLIEATFESREQYLLTKVAHGGDPEITRIVGEDFGKYVDLTSVRYIAVDERHSGG